MYFNIAVLVVLEDSVHFSFFSGFRDIFPIDGIRPIKFDPRRSGPESGRQIRSGPVL